MSNKIMLHDSNQSNSIYTLRPVAGQALQMMCQRRRGVRSAISDVPEPPLGSLCICPLCCPWNVAPFSTIFLPSSCSTLWTIFIQFCGFNTTSALTALKPRSQPDLLPEFQPFMPNSYWVSPPDCARGAANLSLLPFLFRGEHRALTNLMPRCHPRP